MKAIHLTPAQIEQIRAGIAAGDTAGELAAKIGMVRKTLLAQVQRHNLGPWRSRGGPQHAGMCRPVPDDFHVLARTMSNPQLAKHYSCGAVLPARWRIEAGIPLTVKFKGGRHKSATPPDFATFAPGKSVRQVTAHYGLGRDSVKRMFAECGIPMIDGSPKSIAFDRQHAKPATGKLQAYHKAAPVTIHRDISPAGQAADALRRDRWVVYRANEAGQQSQGGKFWVCGKMPVMTDKELVAFVHERAARAARLARAAA